MTSTTTAAAPLSRDETGALLGHTMGLVALTASLFALGAYINRDSSDPYRSVDLAGAWP